MANLTEDDMFEGGGSGRAEDISGPSFEELQAQARAAREMVLNRTPVEPLPPRPQPTRAAPVDDADEVLEEMSREEAESAQLSEVEVRLEKANCYRVLLQDSMFSDYTPATSEVEAEIRTFIQKRLRVLMGIEQDTSGPSGTFSKEEVSALKHLASRVISKNPAPQPTLAKKEEVTPQRPRLKVRASEPAAVAPQQRRTAPVPVSMSTVPEKVKPVRKQKEPAKVELTLPNGITVTTSTEGQVGQKRRSLADLQDIADQATARAMADVQAASENSQINKMLGK